MSVQQLDGTGTKLVYQYIQDRDGVTRIEISNELDIPMLSLYPYLSILEQQGFIEQSGSEYHPTN